VIINKQAICQNSECPDFCEIVQIGTKKGVFLGKTAQSQFLIHSEGNLKTSVIPAGMVYRTHEIDLDYLDSFSQIEKNEGDLKRKGGLKVGSRKIKRRRADLVFRKQAVQGRTLRKKTPPQPGSSPVRKTVHSKCIVEEEVSCLHCGKQIKPRVNSLEPYYCSHCSKGKGMRNPFSHISVGED
jgi:hypothetical protein